MKYTYSKISMKSILHVASAVCIYLNCSFNGIAQSTLHSNGADQSTLDLGGITPNTTMGTTFPCDGKIYFFTDNGTNDPILSYFDGYLPGGTPKITNICTLTGIGTSVNALGANPIDGYLYFLEKVSATTTRFRRIQNNCNIQNVCSTIPWSIAACFDHKGIYWIVDASVTPNKLRGYDISNCNQVRQITLPAGGVSNDITYDNKDCQFYVGDYKIDYATGNSTLLAKGFGGAGLATGSDGNLYSIHNSDIDQYDINNQAIVTILNQGSGGNTDAASFPCASVAPGFSFSIASGCGLPRSVNFTDNSTGLVTTWLWDFGDGTTSTLQNPTHIYATSGPFTVKLTASATTNCITTATGNKSITFSIPANPALNTSSKTDVLCNGGNNGSATVSVSGGVGPFTYAWSPSAGTGTTISNLTADTYSLTVTDNNGCSATTTATITEPTALVLSPLGSILSCAGGADGSVAVIASGGTVTYSYLWSVAGETNTSISNLSAGTYSITVTDKNGCSKIATATVGSPAPIALTPSSTDASCGASNGSASINASGGTSPYNYTWSGGETTSSISNISGGSYTITVTDNKSCSQTAGVVVNNSGAATLSLDSTLVTCNGGSNGSATVSVTGGTSPYTYTWNSTPAQTAATATNLVAGIYTVIVKDNAGCISSLPVNITEPGAIVLVTSQTDASCFGNNNGSITITASGGSGIYTTYSWSSGDSGTTSSTLSAGTYTITVTDDAGCTGVTSLSISQPNVLVSTPASTDVSCSGGNNGTASVSVTGGTMPYKYSWSPNGESLSAISNLSAGNYTVIVSDTNGCTQSVPISISQPSVIGLTTSNVDNLCNGDGIGAVSVTATGGTAPYSYDWLPYNGTSATITGVPPGTYTITVTDKNACTQTATATVIEPPVLTYVSPLTSTNITCNGNNNGTAKIVVTGGTIPYSYTWSPSVGSVDSVGNLSAGTYTIIITDKNGCTENASVTITEPVALSLTMPTASKTDVSCFGGSNGAATVSAAGGTAPYYYSWSPNGETLPGISNLIKGTYTVVVTDTNSCSKSTTVTITEPLAISLTPSSTSVSCSGGTNGTVSTTISGGTGPFICVWAPASGTGTTVSNLSAGTYTVTVTDNNGCSKTAISTITTPPLLTLSGPVATTNVSCFGGNNGTATVSIAGGTTPYTYAWSPSGGNGASVTNFSVGTYTVTITDKNGCSTTAAAAITQPLDIIVTPSGSPVSCNGGNDGTASVTASGGTGPYTYMWSPGGAGTPLSNLTAGTYVVTVTDFNGCQKTSSYVVTKLSAVTASFTANPIKGTAPLTVNFTNNSTGGTFYNWYFGDGGTDNTFNTSHIYQKGDYMAKLVVIGPGGCKDSMMTLIEANEKVIICVPNVFTPNDDGLNDVFDICGQGVVVIEGTIYDRWGLKLYVWDTPKGGWDGRTSSGEKATDGVYYYIIYAQGDDGVPIDPQKGFIQLLRSK